LSKDTKYSYILPIRNRANLLKRGLQSLAAMDYDKDAFEVVIADYISDDNIQDEILEEL
jgi:glycosyltransferase involved in cell wall biosynthesis